MKTRVLPVASTAAGVAFGAPMTASGMGRPSKVYPYVVRWICGEASAIAFMNVTTSS